jgi:hypothetical protein
LLLLASLVICSGRKEIYQVKIFDAHLHFKKDIAAQVKQFENHNIVGGAISGSWISGENYRTGINQKLLFGLMLPCPGGIVPYGGPKCFADGEEFPDINWVRDQILKHKIDFFGELLNEYYGISLSDSSMFPYYALAQELKIPIGIHTGLAGPNHGCPNYNPSMGDPELMRGFLKKFPGLKVWIMHAGAPYLKGTLGILKDYPSVYVDISVISDPDIVTKNDFHSYMKLLVEAGFEDRLMFGSDGGDFSKIIPTINELDFLNTQQKEKIFYKNAQRFFGL